MHAAAASRLCGGVQGLGFRAERDPKFLQSRLFRQGNCVNDIVTSRSKHGLQNSLSLKLLDSAGDQVSHGECDADGTFDA